MQKIFLIDDEKNMLALLEKRLSDAGYAVYTACSGEGIIDRLRDVMPDLILLDVMMPNQDGFQIKAQINAHMSLAGIPVIFVTGRDDIKDKVKGLSLGVDDYITKPFDIDELLARMGAILKRRAFYEKMAMTDGLTGLYNVAFFEKQLRVFFSIAKRYKKMFSLAIIDIDNFKKINDTYGHAAGDFVLKTFAGKIKSTLREADIVMRYGGDEFVVIFPEVDYDQAWCALRRLRSEIEGKEFVFPETNVSIPFAVSFGAASFNHTFENEVQMFDLADKRLYEDKE